jgi:hypothetical protein
MNEAKMLEDQLKDILVAQLEDFEHSLTQLKKKKEIVFESAHGTARHANQLKFNAEVAEVTNSFRKRIQMFREEQKLLDDQKKKIRETIRRYRTQKHLDTVRRMTDTPNRAYSLTLWYSTNNGASYYPYAELPKCARCGEKTILCSHQNATSLIIPLRNPKFSFRSTPWTHIRLANPALKQAVTSGQIKLFQHKSYHEAAIVEDDDDLDAESEDELDIITEDMNTKLPRALRLVWRDYYRKRRGIKPRVQRVLSLEKLLWFIKEIYDIRFRLEEIFYEGVERDNLRQTTAGKQVVIIDDGYGDVTLDEQSLVTPPSTAPAQVAANNKKGAEASPQPSKAENVPPKKRMQQPLTAVLGIGDLEFLKDLKGLRFSEKFIDFFYDFLVFRYHFTDMALIVAHDIFTSLQIHYAENRVCVNPLI